MNSTLKKIFRVYSYICAGIVTLLLIAGIIVWINFGRITASVAERLIDNYNAELNLLIASYFNSAIPGDSVRFESIRILDRRGLEASFSLDDRVIENIDFTSYDRKTNQELISEFGISVGAIPPQVKPLISRTASRLVLNFTDRSGNPVINREISSRDLEELMIN